VFALSTLPEAARPCLGHDVCHRAFIDFTIGALPPSMGCSPEEGAHGQRMPIAVREHAPQEKFDNLRRKINPSGGHLARGRQQFPEQQSTATMTIGVSALDGFSAARLVSGPPRKERSCFSLAWSVAG
jgi:hypothetical protein